MRALMEAPAGTSVCTLNAALTPVGPSRRYDVHHPVTVRNNDIHHNSPNGIENGVPK